MNISVFLSYPRPHMKKQQLFIEILTQYLADHGLEPRTLGVTDYDMEAPLKAIRRLMLESNGLLSVAFRRSIIKDGIYKPASDINEPSHNLTNTWLTSPYCQIEPAMAPLLCGTKKAIMIPAIMQLIPRIKAKHTPKSPSLASESIIFFSIS